MDLNLAGIFLTLFVLVWLPAIWGYVRRYRKWAKILSKIPGPKTLPLFGNALTAWRPREEMYKAANEMVQPFARKYDLMLIWLGPVPVVVLLKAAAARVLLNSTTNIDKPSYYNYMHKWLGTGLLTSTGEKWQQRRKLITPSFHFRILDNFLLTMNEQADILVKLLQKECDDKKISDEFDIYPYITRCTLDIICETAMGKAINAQINTDSKYVDAVYDISKVIAQRMISPWLAPEWIFRLSSAGRMHKHCLKIIHGFTNKIIKTKRAELEKSQKLYKIEEEDELGIGIKRKVAMLDLLLEHSLHDANGRSKLSDEDIREEVDTFMFEAHDTTSSGISWSLFWIGMHPEIQQRIQDEVDSVLGNDCRPITSDDLHQLKYLECCIKESLRLFPPVPFFGRTLRHDLDISGYAVPQGTTVFISPYWIHRDENVYPEPEKFDPDRFLPENFQDKDPFAYIPFSAGPRNCIGQRFAMMEVKVVLSRIFQKFNVKAVEENWQSNVMSELVLKPIRGISVQLEPRDY